MDSSLEDLEAAKELFETDIELMELPHFVSPSKKDSVVDDTIVEKKLKYYNCSLDIPENG